MTKSSRSLAPVSNEDGQISIFFSASLVVLITIIAFVINVGLFVKAKINLQNATDSSAFAGAAVQARQLSTIAYLNWEMRNVYKEWMFKYYVVGNLNVDDVQNPAAANNAISFRLQPTTNVLENNPLRKVMNDPYNFPSVCIHLAGSQTNLCKRYSVPGLPEFGSTNLPGAEEASRAFINTLIGTKILDCVEQTRLNLLVNLTWAYNVLSFGDETIIDQGPQILADRQGAWPKAVEVAMRIRNLEYAVNRVPQTSGVCASGSTNKTSCRTSITQIQQEKKLGNERIVKAFMSGYRNLGNNIEDEMKDSFTLTEIPPKVPDLGGSQSASYLLVPQEKQQGYSKQYLDLQLMMVNYATFYNAFVPRSTGANGMGAKVSGACDVSKVAMPVPGYPLGFYKNPDVLTYYAVRGESEFKGMFNPFGSEPVKLTSYSAAKPFGGRIGPRLFFQPQNAGYFVGRNRPKLRSIPYIAGLDVVGTPNFQTNAPLALGDFSPGTPLPINFAGDYFWLKDKSSPIGGYVPNNDVFFGIPNLVYDYQTPFTDTGYTDASSEINIIQPVLQQAGDKAIGLFSKNQMMMFKGSALNAQVDQQTLEKELNRIKAATLYETANYMVPTPEELNASQEMDSVGFVPGQGVDQGNGIKTYQANIYAPLYSDNDQEDVFWRNGNEVVKTVFEFLRAQKTGIEKYKRNMISAAIEVDRQGLNLAAEAAGARANFTVAAQGIADVPDFAGGINQQIQTCKSLAGLFLFFYFGDGDLDPNIVSQPGGCPQTLGNNLRKYFSNSNPGSSGYSPTHYMMEYSYNPGMKQAPTSLFTAYMPGPYTGVGANGIFNNAIPGVDLGKGDDNNMRRNFYSTKFVGLNSLQATSNFDETLSNFPINSEGRLDSAAGSDTSQKLWRNPLDTQAVGVDVNAIRY
ncbi:MAG: TadE/TadG family type IV pilus assembly protein [Bacteriovoracaceae bacterium]